FVLAANVVLAARVDEARAQVAALEQEKAEEQRRAAARADARKMLDRAGMAVARKDWATARGQFAAAGGKLGDGAGLEDLRKEARAGLAWAGRGARARDQYDRFRALQDEALFPLTRFTGRDPA